MNDRVALVTGGSRGIGREICLGLAARGYAVVVAARTEVDASKAAEFPRYAGGTIHDTARMITDGGGRAVGIPCDLTRAEDIRDLAADALDRFGRIDVLVSNAGVDCESPVADLAVEVLDHCLAVNVRAPVLLCKYVVPGMLARHSGSIIGITSGAARGYRAGRVGYSLSKAALDRMLLSLAEEVRPAGIAVNALSPGRIDTWMNRRGDWPGTEHVPLEQPQTVVPAVVWLAEQTAETFTGQVVARAGFGVSWGPGAPRTSAP